jgi:bacillithiol system protein YtxJ
VNPPGGGQKLRALTMEWNTLSAIDHLRLLQEESKQKRILIFKHSTRCNISRAALDRLERSWKSEEMDNVKPYYLDLISHRDISNQVASQFGVEHESPQVLIIENGKAVYDSSHFNIDYQQIRNVVKN